MCSQRRCLWDFHHRTSHSEVCFLSMGSRQRWLTRLKNELSNSPLVSNVAFGFILMGLEKLVELEFECPCNPSWNGVFSSAFFIIPAVMAFTLMLIFQGCRCDTWCYKSVSLSSFVPAVVWLILLFLDGQYFACAMTDWEGRFVLVDKAAPQKWCEPIKEDDVAPKELMIRSQQLFVVSQVVGIALLILICVGLIVYVIRESRLQDLQASDANIAEMTMYSTGSSSH
ncbi:calcium homeostasis modulator protein 6-like [Denticeps clupeoides]|uniref:calcium homeostasis modulator protein 6-like n=1 Tax=Denticeps clupeoides TaxID=299321 RepID=UPI0010A2F18A|nr:calcium homeostasis modulator protein 6-like [Denticeps clupeoides]XP_028812828.1 calcium homeostasis modulator protein 6-like [Denticeps clupeoides]